MKCLLHNKRLQHKIIRAVTVAVACTVITISRGKKHFFELVQDSNQPSMSHSQKRLKHYLVTVFPVL